MHETLNFTLNVPLSFYAAKFCIFLFDGVVKQVLLLLQMRFCYSSFHNKIAFASYLAYLCKKN